MKKIACDYCYGGGVIEEETISDITPLHHRCPKCHGRGYVNELTEKE